MCYKDSTSAPALQYICKDSAHNSRFDCNHDDYYHTNPPAGSYLATKWNTANSVFLIGGGVYPTSAPTNTPTPTIVLPVGSNLLQNPSFETGSNNIPYYWSRGIWDTTVGRTGTSSLRLDGTGTAQYTYHISTPTGISASPILKPNTTYTLQGWIKTQNVSSTDYGAHIRYAVTQTTSAIFGSSLLKGTTDWTFVQCKFTTHSDYTNGRLDLLAATVTGSQVWFDDVSLCEGSCGTVVNPTSTPVPTIIVATPTPTRTPTPLPTSTPVPTRTPTPIPTAIPTIDPTDTTSPTATITVPLHNSTVTRNRTTTITVNASDNVGVTQVLITISGKGGSYNCAAETVAPYQCAWPVPAKPNDTYTITARAYDAAGNTPGTHSIQVRSSR